MKKHMFLIKKRPATAAHEGTGNSVPNRIVEKVFFFSERSRSISKKVSILLLSVLLIHGQMMWSYLPAGESRSIEDHFTAALKDYQNGLYRQAVLKLETVLDSLCLIYDTNY